MREIWVADSETEGFKHRRIPRPFVWGAYNGCEYHQFTSTAEFVAFFRDKPVIVYAHNGGKFDWHYLIGYLEPWSEIMVINGRIAKFKIGECEFRDSYNILPVPLAAYKKDEIDYGLFEPELRVLPKNWKMICDYLRSDCVYLYQLVREFIDTYGLNLTLAGSAMKFWRGMAESTVPETNRAFYERMSPFYYGGRVECFQTGLIESPFNVIDINSAYPFAMLQNHAFGPRMNSSAALPNSRAYTERSFIRLIGISDGALPHRLADNTLVFPNDGIAREYWVTGWEFLAAVETRTLRDWEILECLTFDDSINFREYVNYFYALKQAASDDKQSPAYIFAKLFLTSLYGKFGANPDKYEEFMIVRPQHIEAAEADGGYHFVAELDRYALVARPVLSERQRYYNVATAASVTGFVRAYLWRALQQCAGVLYCDTDSIACADSGSLALDPKRLGAWDLEAQCDHGGIAGKKLYAFHTLAGKWKTASKGVKLSAAEIMHVAAGNEAIYKPIAPTFSIKRDIRIFGPESESPSNLDKMFQTRTIKIRA